MTAATYQDAGAQDPASTAWIVSFVATGANAGRTSVVANLAWMLSSAGRRVLVIDLDPHERRVQGYLPTYPTRTGPVGSLLPADLGHALATLLSHPADASWSGRATVGLVPESQPQPGDLRTPHAHPALRLERYVPFGVPTGGVLDLVWRPVGEPGPDDFTVPGHTDLLSVSQLRRNLRTSGYDFVLVDEPPSPDGTVGGRIAAVSDAVAVCLTYHRQRLDDATEIARRISRQVPGGLQTIVVTAHFDDPDSAEGRRNRQHIRQAFRAALDDVDHVVAAAPPAGATAAVGAPGQELLFFELPHVDQDRTLIPLAEDGPVRRSMLAGYQPLFNALAQRAAQPVPLVSDLARRRYRRSRGLQSTVEPERIHLVHSLRDRPWADWIRVQLEGAGLAAPRLVLGSDSGDMPVGGTVLVIGSDARSSALIRLLDRLRPAPGAGAGAEVLVALTAPAPATGAQADGTPAADDLPGVRTAYLTGRGAEPEEEARERLFALLGLARDSRPGTPAGWQPRFPIRPAIPSPTRLGLPRPIRPFVGRQQEVEAVRDRLIASRDARVVSVEGPPAVGKSGIAQTYVDLFGGDYDVIAWLPAHDDREIRARLTQLAVRLGVPPKKDPVYEVLQRLRTRRSPWLLVYDGATEVLDASLLPPGGSGHVLVTWTTPVLPGATAGTVEVAALNRSDGVTLLRAQARDVSDEHANLLLGRLGRMPLTLRLAAGVLWQAGFILSGEQGVAQSRAADAAVPAFLDALGPGPDPATPVDGLRDALAVALRLLRDDVTGRRATALAQFCSFVSPDGIALRVLRSRPVVEQLAAALAEQSGATEEETTALRDEATALRQDAWELEHALAAGTRYGLFDVDWGSGARLYMHPALQAAVRDAMGEELARRRQTQLQLGLAGFAPGDGLVDLTDQVRADLAELQTHLPSSGALTADGPPEVRLWVVTQVGYLSRTPGTEQQLEGLRIGRSVLAHWRATTDVPDRLTLRLATHLADLERADGRPDSALALDTRAIEEGAALLGPDHPRVLVNRRGRAGDQRGLGQFQAARAEDRVTWMTFRDTLGNDHPQTLRAAHNFGLSSYLAGFVEDALARESDVLDRRRRLFGDDDPLTWWSAGDVGTYHRELGRLAEAIELLAEAHQQLLRIHRSNDHPDVLRIAARLGVTQRRAGAGDPAKDLNGATLVALRRVLGEHHPRTRACQLNVAADYYLADEPRPAVESAQDALRGYEDQYRTDAGDHPFTAICRTNLAVYLARVGQHEQSVALGQQALDGLRDRRRGELTHPWTLGAALNQAGNLAEAGQVVAARQLLSETLPQCRLFLGTDHRYVTVAVQGLARLESPTDPVDGTVSTRAVAYVDIEVPET